MAEWSRKSVKTRIAPRDKCMNDAMFRVSSPNLSQPIAPKQGSRTEEKGRVLSSIASCLQSCESLLDKQVNKLVARDARHATACCAHGRTSSTGLAALLNRSHGVKAKVCVTRMNSGSGIRS